MTCPIRTLLVANRGEIACRIFRTARRMGMECVAVYSDADASAPHVRISDRAVRLGPAPAAESYLRSDLVIAAARAAGADAVHPGYGFLSENAEFAEAVEGAGLVWVGPPPTAIRAMGLKGEAKRIMAEAGVPVVPGYHGDAQDADTLRTEAEAIGYAVLIKAVAGGGGKGMRVVERAADFADALHSAQREGRNAFGNDRVLIERLIASPRHIEVQVFGDAHGNAVHLGERDCSLQRRHQKVIEEAPAPGITPAIREAMGAAAVRAAEAVSYRGAGTVEFIVDGARFRAAARGEVSPDECFHFMEMNTRLQVEHPVTEAVTGLNLVEWQLRVARGEALPLAQDAIALSGHAVEARLYAEDANAGFLPATGTLHRLGFPSGVRADRGVGEGDRVTPYYDPMIAKLIAHAPTRGEALARLGDGLRNTEVAGTVTNRDVLIRLLDDDAVQEGDVDTGLIGRRGDALAADAEPSEAVWLLAGLAAGGMLPPAPRAGFRVWGRARAFVPLGFDDDVRDLVITGPDEDGAYALERAGSDGGESGALRIVHCDAAPTGDVRRIAVRSQWERMVGDIAVAHALDAVVVLHPGAKPGGRAATVLVGGDTYRFLMPDPLNAAAGAGGGGDAVSAPMPGTLIALDVVEGDRVEAGQRLAVLEAMKMEHPLLAPRAGTVAHVHGAVGGSVAAGDAVVVLEDEAEG